MLTLCWGAKGGTGTTLVAAGLALARPDPALLVDLAGDLPHVLGASEPAGPGVVDWLASDAPADRLGGLETPLDATRAMLPRGTIPPDQAAARSARWQVLADRLVGDARHVVVDAGCHPPPALTTAADVRWLVVRNCYLTLRAAAVAATEVPPTGGILVSEPGRRLGVRDVEQAIGAPVVAVVLHDPAIARAADAGLLLGRLPGGLRAPLAGLAEVTGCAT